MNDIIYEYIDCTSESFKEVIELRFDVLFKPYNKIHKYEYDELDSISYHLVALDKEKVVGYSRITNFNGKGKITNVAVSPEYLRRGIGLKMLKEHIAKAKENNMNRLYLNSRLDTVGFYKKVGFICEGDTFVSDKSGLMLQQMYYEIN